MYVRPPRYWMEHGVGKEGVGLTFFGIRNPNLAFPVIMKAYFSRRAEKTYLFNSLLALFTIGNS